MKHTKRLLAALLTLALTLTLALPVFASENEPPVYCYADCVEPILPEAHGMPDTPLDWAIVYSLMLLAIPVSLVAGALFLVSWPFRWLFGLT